MSDMEWTTEYPKEVGYYWVKNLVFRGDHCSQYRAQVVDVGFNGIWLTGNDVLIYREEIASAEWYGPIQPPA